MLSFQKILDCFIISYILIYICIVCIYCYDYLFNVFFFINTEHIRSPSSSERLFFLYVHNLFPITIRLSVQKGALWGGMEVNCWSESSPASTTRVNSCCSAPLNVCNNNFCSPNNFISIYCGNNVEITFSLDKTCCLSLKCNQNTT